MTSISLAGSNYFWSLSAAILCLSDSGNRVILYFYLVSNPPSTSTAEYSTLLNVVLQLFSKPVYFEKRSLESTSDHVSTC